MKVSKNVLSFMVVLSGFILLMGLIIAPAVYGVILAFHASILLGVIVLVVQPSPTIIGWVAIFGHPEFCSKIAAWLHLP